MVDTGSMVTLMTYTAFKTLGINEDQIEPCLDNIFSYSNHKLQTKGKVKLEVRFSQGDRISHECIIVPDKYMSTGMLLGFDMIRRKIFTWEPTTQDFIWNSERYPTVNQRLYTVGKVTITNSVKVNNIQSQNKGVDIRLTEKQILKPGEIVWITCKAKENKMYEITFQQVKPMGKCVGLARQCIVESLPNGDFSFPIHNPNGKIVRLKKGTIIGSRQQISEKDIRYVNRSNQKQLSSLEEMVRKLGEPEWHGRNITVCTTHKHILTPFFPDSDTDKRTPTLLVSSSYRCDICDGIPNFNTVGSIQEKPQWEVVNEMLPHADSSKVENRSSREEKLRELVSQLDLGHIQKGKKVELEKILMQHVDLFILDEKDMGCIKVPENHISIVDKDPVRMPMYRHPEKAKEIISEMIEDMLDKGIIENSYATYLSPIVLINKPNGSKRMCIDFRGVNKKIKVDIHPLPRLDELVDEVAGNKYYCTLDMKDAYYQCTLDEQSRDITTFSDGKNLYRFKRLPFGLNVAPAIFTRVMQEVLRPLLKLGFVKNYLDDVIIFAPDYETLLQRINLTFTRLTEMGVKLNVSKCHFAQTRIKFLGHIVSEKGVEVSPENVEAVQKMVEPKTTREVRRFIGMCSFYRKFIPNFAKIAAPLTTLQSKLVKFVWSPECQEAFDTLKSKLITTPILTKAKMQREFELHTDASEYHVGAVLMQREDDGLHPIGYFSQKLNKTERKYSVTDKEALGIVKATRHFHHYLWGKRFLIVTDHQPLTTIFKKRSHSPRMSRYLLEMRDYNFDIIYKRGAVNYVPDSLSRPHSRQVRVNRVTDNASWSRFPGLTVERIKEEQRKDKRWKQVLDYCDGGKIPKKLPGNRTLSCFEVRDGVLYLRREEFRRITFCLVVPESLRSVACSIVHNETHLGQHKSVRRAQQYFYWPRMWKDIVHYVKSCTVCQQFKEPGAIIHEWQELPPVENKGKRVAIDLIDMHHSHTGQRYCLTVMDHFSRFIRAYPIRNKSTPVVLKALKTDICMFGTPEVALMDNGSEFTSHEFRIFCKKAGISQVTCLPYHPRGNSILERAHRTLKSVVAMLSQEHPNTWPNFLPEAVKILNESVHTSLGTSPFFVHYGYHPLRRIGQLELPDQEDDENENSDQTLRDKIRDTLKSKTDYYRTKANVNRQNSPLKVGDLAWIYQEIPLPGTAVKLNQKWIGPYRVVEVIGNGRAYELVSPLEDIRVRRAAGKLKKYIPREELLDQIEESFLTEDEARDLLPDVRVRRPPDWYRP